MLPTLLPLPIIMTCPLRVMPSYSKIFVVKPFANCPETTKFAKLFTYERFLLYSIYGTAFFAGLNCLQVDQVNKENDSLTSIYTQLVANSLQTVLHVYSIVWVWVHAAPEIHTQKSKKCPKKNVFHTEGPFCGCSLPVIAHTQPQSRKGRCPIAEQSFGTQDICIHQIVFKLCMMENKSVKMNKIKMFTFDFLNPRERLAELMEQSYTFNSSGIAKGM